MASESLDELRAALNQGRKLSMQGSFGRRAPEPSAVPYLRKARDGLANYVRDAGQQEAEAWRLLSEAEECLLSYAMAIKALERAMALGQRDRKDLKRLALLKQYARDWSALPLSPEQLEALGQFLRDRLGDDTGERSFRWTQEWLHAAGVSDPGVVIAALEARGAFSDFQVLYNVIRG